MTNILNEQETLDAKSTLEAKMNDAINAVKNNQKLLAAGVIAQKAGQKTGEVLVKGLDQCTKAKRIVSFFGSEMISSFKKSIKESMEKKRQQDKVIDDAISLFKQNSK